MKRNTTATLKLQLDTADPRFDRLRQLFNDTASDLIAQFEELRRKVEELRQLVEPELPLGKGGKS